MTSERVTITPQLVIGVFFMLAGILMTLDRLQILDASYSLRFWPTVFLVLGMWLVTQRRDGRSRFWGTVWLLVGTWLLLNSLGVVRVGFWELVWPILIIWLGVSLIRQTLGRSGQPGAKRGEAAGFFDWAQARFTPKSDGSGTVALFALMGESKRTVTDQSFRGGEMTAVMGGCVLDLRQATPAAGEQATIDVFALMAGHEIWVPGDWTVVSHILPIMGGFEDKRLPKDTAALPAGDNRPRLLLRGFVVMGGLEIKG